jgi:uncharacterized membrane protein YjjP (DUF1212 family)
MSDLSPEAIEFVLRAGRAFHRHGFSASRVEEVMVRLAERLGLPLAQIFSTPTSIMAAFGPLGAQRSHLLRVDPGSMNLAQVSQLDRLAIAVVQGELSPAEGIVRLREIETQPPVYGPLATVGAFVAASGSVSVFLGGGRAELLVASLIGLLTGLLALYAARRPRLLRVFEPVVALMASLVAGIATRLVLPHSVYVATLAGLIVLIPGFSLTVAVRELSTQHLASGTARFASATATFLGIGFGVALGERVVALILGEVPELAAVPFAGWALPIAIGVAGLAFAVILQAERRDTLRIMVIGLVAVAAGRIGARLLGLELGAFVGAVAVGIIGNLFARRRNRPSLVLMVPGILMLVPGTIGFRSISALLESQVVTGVGTLFRMLLTAVAIASGLLIADLVSPTRRLTG